MCTASRSSLTARVLADEAHYSDGPPTWLNAPEGYTLPVRDIRPYTGAGWLVPLCGDVLQMPGLGKKPAALMRGHGAVIVAESLHVVVGRAYYLNMNARLQRQAMSLGGPVTYLTAEEADKAGAQDGFERAWDFWRSKVGK